MIQKIKVLLLKVPFVPFKIRTSDGHEYIIPTSDHAAVPPTSSRVIVFDDQEHETSLSGLHIVAVEEGVELVK